MCTDTFCYCAQNDTIQDTFIKLMWDPRQELALRTKLSEYLTGHQWGILIRLYSDKDGEVHSKQNTLITIFL